MESNCAKQTQRERVMYTARQCHYMCAGDGEERECDARGEVRKCAREGVMNS
jgi:hypothetical protein